MTDHHVMQIMLHGYTDKELEDGATGIVDRARQVRADGWGHNAKIWPKGSVHAVAYVLDDTQMIDDLDETRESILTKMAYNFYGAVGGRAEEKSGFPRTRAYFADIARRIDS